MNKLHLAPFVNQVGATALGQIIIYENAEVELGELGDKPSKPWPVKSIMQIAAYQSTIESK